MSKFICDYCGIPTDNDQSFIIPPCFKGDRPLVIERHRCDKCQRRFTQESEWESEGATIDVDSVTCPYCGYVYCDDEGYQFDEGETEEVECPACSRRFDVEVEVKRTYSVKRSLCEMPENYGDEDEEEDT
jgi:DNA-directed RNA polymerase subunit RPC12/RpoP